MDDSTGNDQKGKTHPRVTASSFTHVKGEPVQFVQRGDDTDCAIVSVKYPDWSIGVGEDQTIGFNDNNIYLMDRTKETDHQKWRLQPPEKAVAGIFQKIGLKTGLQRTDSVSIDALRTRLQTQSQANRVLITCMMVGSGCQRYGRRADMEGRHQRIPCGPQHMYHTKSWC